MSWVPPNIAQTCAMQATITSCQPQSFLFLQLVAQLFGYSLDSPPLPTNSNPTLRLYKTFEQTKLFDTGGGYGKQQFVDEYDFIVVGAGSAGCVVANRLTEISNWRVLLLEAGGEEPEVASVPAFAPTLQGSSIDWNFMTQPSPYACLARRNGQCAWNRGLVMGGSSTINYMIYLRGNPRDYDEWAEKGNYGWSYQEVLPYFIKSERNGDIPNVAPGVHGTKGYLSVERFRYQDENVRAVLRAFEEAGLRIYDQNSGEQIGASLLQTTSNNGRRHSANVAYIRPIRNKRRNLVIQTEAYVTRLLIDPATKTAIGVEYLRNGRLVQVRARKEVILSAGAILSPKVLMLSGMGPAHHLEEFGIPILQDLPVGYNLMDHPTLDNVLFQITNKTSTLVDSQQESEDMQYYRNNNAGPLSSTGPLQLNAFVQSKYEQEPGRPDIQYSIDCGNLNDILIDPILASETKVGPLSYYDTFIIRSIVLNQDSRGVIRLNNTDPIYGPPLIYANTFEQEIDLLRMVEGIKQSLNLLVTPSFQRLGVSLVTYPMPACAHFPFGSDEYWGCLARSYTGTMYHYSGTCKMGPESDKSAVVDPELRVHGIKNLRVVDASIMPRIPRGNTNGPTIMVAEKASDLIKLTWLKSKLKLNAKHKFLNILNYLFYRK